MQRDRAEIGIIGGSGLYQMEALQETRERTVATPFGKPSGPFVLGTLEGVRVAFLPRHGRGHTLLPSEVNFRANIYAMKQLGVTGILSVSAVGSMKSEIAPGHIVVPDQFYDLTRGRESTFFGKGIVAHVSFADPICPHLAKAVFEAAQAVGATVHRGGAYLCVEGPQFSSRAESYLYRTWNVSVIGMTNATEAKLAREAEICYVTVALATDYDCWHVSEAPVTTEQVVKTLLANVALSKKIVQAAVHRIDSRRDCACRKAMQHAMLTDPRFIPKKRKEDLKLIIGQYVEEKREGR